jgi:Ca2+-binding RTX toxin-like protein
VKRAGLLIVAAAVALLLVSGIAVALTFTCNQNKCRGTNGNDTIYGTRVGNSIHSLEGADLVRGNGGRDRLSGDGGNDRLNAGNGDDRVEAADGNIDAISCGSGRHDIVIFDRRLDSVTRCEIKRRR